MSEVQIPAASTRANICCGPGRGVGTLRTPKWEKPVPSRTTARISFGMAGARWDSSPLLLLASLASPAVSPCAMFHP